MSQTPAPSPDEPSTSWTLFGRAHDPAAPPEARDRARQELVCRYLGVARRYLAGALRGAPNPGDAVEDLVGEFAVRVMAGKLHNVSADRGRFRPYLQTMLCHLVHDHHRDRGRQPEALDGRDVEATQFQQAWRDGLMANALAALQDFERQTGQVLHTVLRLRMDQPHQSAAALAEGFTGRSGRPVTAGWLRKRLHLARRKLWDLLVREVRASLPEGAPEADLQEELAELDLLRYRPGP